jgi:hypothetical protein
MSIGDEPESLRDLSSDRIAISPYPVLFKTHSHLIDFESVNNGVTKG